MRLSLGEVALMVALLAISIEVSVAMGHAGLLYVNMLERYVKLHYSYVNLNQTYHTLNENYLRISENYTSLVNKYNLLYMNYSKMSLNYTVLTYQFLSLNNSYNSCLVRLNNATALANAYSAMVNELEINNTALMLKVSELSTNLSICNASLSTLAFKYSNSSELIRNLTSLLYNLYSNYTTLKSMYNNLAINYTRVENTLNAYVNKTASLNNTLNYLLSGGFVYSYDKDSLGVNCTVRIINEGSVGFIDIVLNPATAVIDMATSRNVLVVMDVPIGSGNPILAFIGNLSITQLGAVINAEVTIKLNSNVIELINPINIIASLEVIDTVYIPVKQYYVGSVTITPYNPAESPAVQLLYSLQNQNAVSSLCVIRLVGFG